MFDLQGLQGLWMNWKKGELFDLSNEQNQEIFIFKISQSEILANSQ
jgi:hypothetical protein